MNLRESMPPAPAVDKAAIEIRNLFYRYPDGQQALRGINLRVMPGESVAILGPNGAGKSTLLLHLNGILQGEGEIHIGGLPLTKEHLPEIRRRVGLVFQDPDDQLFMPTVFEDVAFGPLNLGLKPEEVRERVERALLQVGLSHYQHRSAHHLSFGEKKRVCLATVLAMDPCILALDEPTSNLDPRSRRRLIALLAGISLTRIITTHDLDLVHQLCPRVVIMDQGQVVADGPSSVILQDQDLLEAHGLI